MMTRKLTAIALSGLAAVSFWHAQAHAFEGLGRSATTAEVKAWDIDVRPDFKGLPKGQGSVARGTEVWESKCASCHGVFGESNEVFTPIVGGVTAKDIETGRVEALRTGSNPQRTTLMKVPTLSTLWDYINRAMPWNAPKSLSTDDVYAVTAYILSLAAVVPDDFVLSDQNIAQVQQRMPNRNGMSAAHGMWLPSGKPDVSEKRCMSNCAKKVSVVSSIPDFARDAHGNIADQNRLVGQVRGQVTVANASAAKPAAVVSKGADLFNAQGCVACHAAKDARVGPALSEIARKYKDQTGAVAQLSGKIRGGSQGVWGSMPMPPQAQLSEQEAQTLAQWVLETSH